MATLQEIAAELMQVDGIRERVMEAREIKAALYRIEDTINSGAEMHKYEWKKLEEDIDILRMGLCYQLMELYELNTPISIGHLKDKAYRDIIYKLVHQR